MSATFYERMIRIGDYANDGDVVDVNTLLAAMSLYAAGTMSAADVKTMLSNSTAQSADIQAILNTLPGTITATILGITVLNTNAFDRALWANHIYGCALAGVLGISGYTTEAGLKAKLGV